MDEYAASHQSERFAGFQVAGGFNSVVIGNFTSGTSLLNNIGFSTEHISIGSVPEPSWLSLLALGCLAAIGGLRAPLRPLDSG
jgi:hypothetical protein